MAGFSLVFLFYQPGNKQVSKIQFGIATFSFNNETPAIMSMNRSFALLLLVVSLTISSQAFAQVRLGVKGGVNASKIRFALFDTDPIPGYELGLLADFGLSPHFSIQPALLINAKGFSVDLDTRDQAG
ncbi:hypothetical protein EZE20_22270 [Arundinibacter roseus]|uniref:PorT family protein n=2 Tax=Arundinibacter roseus TaxID=2070510 RepID=A0A4R4JXX5_9BACT|nr:hypothetical protein EZE20_22270 [Arundinibacter roseus]